MNNNKKYFNAVRNGNLNEIKKFVNNNGLTAENGYALLCVSIKNNRKEITKFLIESGAKVNTHIINKRKKLSDTPLHHAAKNGHTDIIELLLSHGANIHAKNEYGGTALQTAVYHKQLAIIELLLQRGAYIDEKKNDGTTSLHTAVEGGDLNVIELLLKNKANVDAAIISSRKDGQTALHMAAEKGRDKIVDLLIKYRATVNAKTKNGVTPIWIATQHGHDKVVKALLDNGACVDTRDITSGKTILFLAVEMGILKIVRYILDHKPDIECTQNKMSLVRAMIGTAPQHKLILDKLLKHGFTFVVDYNLLVLAIEKGCTDIAKQCLETKADTLLKNVPHRTSPLHLAIKCKQFDIVKMLLNYNVDVNGFDEYDRTPLFYATLTGHVETVKLLLAHKASVTTCPGLLINAVRNDSKEIVNLLLRQPNIDVNEIDKKTLKRPLHFCAHNEATDGWDSIFFKPQFRNAAEHAAKPPSTEVKCEIAKILLDAGADINAKCIDGKSTLHYACLKGYDHLVGVLFEHGAKIFADDTGDTPLHLNTYNGNMNILKMLISNGADVNAKTEDGSTPVHYATHEVQIGFLEHLLKNGANVDEKEENGSTALHIAAENDYCDFVELLLKYGADIDATDNRGWSALYIATNCGNSSVVRTLLEFGCNLQQKRPKTPNSMPSELAIMQGLNIFAEMFNNLDSDDDDIHDYDYRNINGLDDCFFDEYDDYDDYDDYHDYMNSDDDFNDSDMDFLEHRPGGIGDVGNMFSAPANTISGMLLQHYIMMMAANIPICDGDTAPELEGLDDISSNSVLTNFKIKCEEEVVTLKSQKISPETNVTFHDIVAKPVDRVTIYVRNPKIAEVLKTNAYKEKFPIYSGLLNGKISRAFNRKELLDRGNQFFDSLMESLAIGLPYNCIENICSYLTDKDLIILAEVTKPKKIK